MRSINDVIRLSNEDIFSHVCLFYFSTYYTLEVFAILYHLVDIYIVRYQFQ
jgi:hypothetical protein